MKKLLSILASFGLTATTAISVVSCGTDKGESETKEQIEAKIPQEGYSIMLESTPKGQVLTKADQEKVTNRILEKLTKLNVEAITDNEHTFVFELTEVTTDTKLIPIEVKETQSTSEKSGLKATKFDLKVNFTLLEDKTELLRQIDEIISQPLVISGTPSGAEIKAEDVEKEIQEKLKQFEQDLELKIVEFVPFSVDVKNGQFDIKNGSLTLNIFFSDESLVNPETDNGQFKFTFINEDYQDYDQVGQVNQVLTKIKEGTKENPLQMNLSNLFVHIPILGEGPLGETLSAIAPMILDYIPDKIPAQFNDQDETWLWWQAALKSIQGALKWAMDIDIDEEMSFSFELGFGTMKAKIDLKITISKLLTAILPDLVHLRNFLREQLNLGSDNFLLLLIQYLFDEPRDIDDEFTSINQKIPDVNNPDEFLKFNTNLERLAHDLFHGWQTTEGIMWKENQNKNLDPISLKGEFGIKFCLKYQANKEAPEDPEYMEMKIFELLPIENIKSVFTQIFNYDLNTPLNIVIKPFGPIEIPVELPLGSLIKDNLKNILRSDPELRVLLEDINNLSFDWKDGSLKVNILNSEGEWITPQNFDDLLKAKDLQVEFLVKNLDVKYKDLVVSLKDIYINFNLDLRTDENWF